MNFKWKNKRNRHMAFSMVMVLLVAMILSGCTDNPLAILKLKRDYGKVQVTEMADSETLSEVEDALNKSGLSNTREFYDWVKDFSIVAGKKANLTKNWVEPSEINSDIYACMDGWEQKYDYSDSDCRMTAMLLLDGVLKSAKTRGRYEGTYLAFDLDAIDNVDKYKNIKKNRDLFTTVFGEYDVDEKEKAKDVFPRIWQENGIILDNENISLISVVIFDEEMNQVFVGHTGILVDCQDYLLFVEKLAFQQPYRAAKLEKIEGLVEIFKTRTDYFMGENLKGTYVYRNDELIFGK